MKLCGVLKRLMPMCAILLVCSVCIPGSVLGADVAVYAEGAYTDTDLVLYVYADITNGAILSFGVKVAYPEGLTYTGATKNETVWYFGNGTPEFDYMEPENDGSGVVIIGGKLDATNPTEGVQGNRVLLGTVNFTHSGMTDFSGVSVSYGRGDGSDDYKNFVDVDGGVVDGTVSFSTEIHERGDANADGNVNAVDYVSIRNNINASDFPPWMDCNEDNSVNAVDYVCIRNKI